MLNVNKDPAFFTFLCNYSPPLEILANLDFLKPLG